MNRPIFIPSLKFPTPDHKRAAEAAAVFFLSHTAVDTILVENSCARGQAVPESDLNQIPYFVRRELYFQAFDRL
jgi:hypothetical protein